MAMNEMLTPAGTRDAAAKALAQVDVGDEIVSVMRRVKVANGGWDGVPSKGDPHGVMTTLHRGKKQYGVQIVWKDPVKAGACKEGETYVPRWDVFDSERFADGFAARYRATFALLMPNRFRDGVDLYASEHIEALDPNEVWQDSDVLEVNRATRWAVEVYGEWET